MFSIVNLKTSLSETLRKIKQSDRRFALLSLVQNSELSFLTPASELIKVPERNNRYSYDQGRNQVSRPYKSGGRMRTRHRARPRVRIAGRNG